jgi:DNA-binding transcriptional LysR family regulator
MAQSDLNGMAIYTQVVQSGSFTAAAQALGMPKSTVSQRVAELEARLGLQLLQRSTRRLSLTAAGQLYLTHCLRMLEAAEAADAAVSRLRADPAGRLRITAPEASGLRLFGPLLPAFRARYPMIELDFVVTDAHLDLIAERIDLAFRTGRLDDSGYVVRRTSLVRRVLVASPAYLAGAGAGRPGNPDDLLRHQSLIHYPAPRWPLMRDGQAVEITPPNEALRSNSLMCLLAAALAGGGIAMLPAFMCRAEIAAGELELLLPDTPPTSNNYYALTPGRGPMSAALSAFLDFMREQGLADRLSA